MSFISWIRYGAFALVAAALLIGAAQQRAQAVDGMAGGSAKVGAAAPGFTLTDLNGTTVSLSDFAGKTVVLEWFNPGCPYVVAYYEGSTAMNTLKSQLEGSGVVWLAVNSSAPGKEGSDLQMNKDKAAAWGIENPVLVDSDGKVGKAYGARRTPELFVIDPTGTLVYRGAADEGGISGEPGGGRAFVLEAVQAITAGEAPAIMETRPVGCGVKYAD